MRLIKSTAILLLVVISISSIAQEKVIDRVIAVVGDHPILLSEVEEQKMQAYEQGEDKTPNLACLILEELMLEKLLLHQAEIDSIEIPEGQVNQELNQRIEYFASQMPDGKEGLVRFYGKSISEIKDEFYVQIENRMKTQQIQSSITADVSVSPKQVKAFYKSFPDDSIPLVGSKVEVAQIILNPIITDEEKKMVKEELQELRDNIVSGTLSFEAAAKFKSCDKGSAEKGGDFGWVGRGQFVPEFEEMAYNTPINEVSPIFESQYGYHILKIEKRRGEQFYGRHILLCLKASYEQLAVCKKRMDSIKSQIEVGNLPWDTAVAMYSSDDMTKATNGIVYNQNSGTSLLDMQELDPVTFQQLDPLKVGDISKPYLFETFDGQSYKMIKLNRRTTPHMANLNDDYQMIQKYALQNNQNDKLTNWVNTKMIDVYIRLDDEFKNCDYRFNWTRKN